MGRIGVRPGPVTTKDFSRGAARAVDDKRNIILAVVLTALILFGWPYVAERLFPASMRPAPKLWDTNVSSAKRVPNPTIITAM